MRNPLKLSSIWLGCGAVLLYSATASATNWSATNLGGAFDSVTADSHNGYIDVFASVWTGSTADVSFRTWSPGVAAPGSWSPWQSVGSPPPGGYGACTAVSVWRNHGQVWTTGFDGGAWVYTVWNGSPDAGGWQTIGGPPPGIWGCVHAVSWGDGRLDVFVTGGDQHLWHTWFDNGWAGWWEPLGGEFIGDPYPVSSDSGQLDIFVLSTDNTLWDLKWNGPDHPGWWWWWNLGINNDGHSNAPPRGAKSGTGTTLGVALGDPGIRGREYISGSWGPITSTPNPSADFNYSSVYRGGTRVDTFFFAPWDGTIKYRKYDRAAGGWSGRLETSGSGYDWNAWPEAITTSPTTAHVFVLKPNGNVMQLTGLGL
jgi:hypothetical protein